MFYCCSVFFFYFMYPATNEIYTYWQTLSLHDALPISAVVQAERFGRACGVRGPFEDHLGIARPDALAAGLAARIVGDADVAQRAAVGQRDLFTAGHGERFAVGDRAHAAGTGGGDRKSTRLNSSH